MVHQGLEEGVSTRELVYAAILLKTGVSRKSALSSTLIEPLNLHLVGCQYAPERTPAIIEAASAAWWIDKGAGGHALRGAPYALMEAAKAFSQGRDRGVDDGLKRDHPPGGGGK